MALRKNIAVNYIDGSSWTSGGGTRFDVQTDRGEHVSIYVPPCAAWSIIKALRKSANIELRFARNHVEEIKKAANSEEGN